MKFNSLKVANGFIAFALCLFIGACNNETEKNSTQDDENKASGSSTSAFPDEPTSGTASTSIATGSDANVEVQKNKTGNNISTEVLPAYSGGQDALEWYVTNNIEYPQEAIDNGIEGTVNVQFAVDEKGNVSNVKVVGNKLGYGLEEEAVRVVASMNKWTPGQVRGKNVKTMRTLPIIYRLES